jgi:uncharacterized damage-inducible protein DinB
MSVQKLMMSSASYNRWANETMLGWLGAKPEASLSQEVPSSFSSILKTLNHIWAVEQFWLSVVTESATVGSSRYMAQEFDQAEIFAGLAETSNALVDFVATLSEEDLQKKVYLDTPWVKGELARYEFLQHVFMHSIYHRGQVTTIGRNVGITDAPMTDYNFFNMALPQMA